ncbi:hypothetical protein EV426DRAFT_616077 [Tirmania nivea]|nr:hypothetical protein EV426DRAFT_616077 [Tirmania nivea]
MDVILGSEAEGVKGMGTGVDWVITLRDPTAWGKLKEGVEAWEGFAGYWVGKEVAGFGHEEAREEVIVRAERVKGELKSGAVRGWVEGKGDEGREAFEQGWEAGFRDAVGFWRGAGVEGGNGAAVGLGLKDMMDGAHAGSGVCARIGRLGGWVGRRVRLWVEAAAGVGEGKEVLWVREFAEGVRCGVGAFEREVIAPKAA